MGEVSTLLLKQQLNRIEEKIDRLRHDAELEQAIGVGILISIIGSKRVDEFVDAGKDWMHGKR